MKLHQIPGEITHSPVSSSVNECSLNGVSKPKLYGGHYFRSNKEPLVVTMLVTTVAGQQCLDCVLKSPSADRAAAHPVPAQTWLMVWMGFLTYGSI